METVKIGDKFTNSYDNVCIVKQVIKAGSYHVCKVQMPSGSYTVSMTEMLNRLKIGMYYNYKPKQAHKTSDNPFKKGDIVTINSSDRIYCSHDFKAEIISSSSSGIRFKVLEGTYGYHTGSRLDNEQRIAGYISGTINIKYIKYFKTNKTETNEQTRKIDSVTRCKEKPTAIKSSSTREVTIASTLIGNAVNNCVKRTRIRQFEILKISISA
jgi:hypothetical protein